MVYVDPLKGVRKWPKARQLRCYLVADTLDELHTFARELDIPRDAFNFPPRHDFPYYSLSTIQREKAVAKGAVEVSTEKAISVAESCGFILR